VRAILEALQIVADCALVICRPVWPTGVYIAPNVDRVGHAMLGGSWAQANQYH
jgi:hypothetical protein